ncbi:glycosyltransferase family 22 protein [Epithele typhae]|uniref:glycosyltransferase family 22 protein n=1 Tax=Epithele typhae TaxID=378194 RepID=UPI0020082C84|nr:glycosyltransferase family 22 protein [Epithele typhae]KAH9944005.1 glycosyltransferase family 22 protein [Epithele typhae]
MSTGFQANPTTSAASTKPKNRHSGLLQDQLRRAQRAPWCPSWSAALRILLLVRVTGAMYSGIQDCDEVFNFWEPLHYLWKGYGFQTWETSPEYSIRSWAYILLHYFPVGVSSTFIGPEKRPAFFAVRILLAIVSSLCEVTLYRTVVEHVNYRVGRYLFFVMMFSSGMWIASTAAERDNKRRTMFATLSFAAGAIVGWPFAAVLGVPFVFEELFLAGADKVTPEKYGSWLAERWERMLECFVAGTALVVSPGRGMDSLFYGKLAVVPWNIIRYNVFPDSARGPELYGTEPVHFYVLNLLLNFNVLVPFALMALPALAITYRVDKKRLGERYQFVNQSSPYTLLALRLAPMYVWLAIMTAQKHKEERFMYPIYPLICFNAAVAIYLVRGWLEVVFIAATNSPYQASRSSLFRLFTFSVIGVSAVLSLSRIVAQWKYYHSPMSVTYALEATEVPHLLNSTGHVVLPPHFGQTHNKATSHEDEYEELRIDLGLIEDWGLRMCVGKEWYRFPGHFLVPDGVRVDWVKSEFDGMLPGHFTETGHRGNLGVLTNYGKGLLERVKGTRAVGKGLNDLNKEEPSFYVKVEECDYMLDLDFPLHPTASALEPRYGADEETWAKVACQPFLDARHSSLLTRTLWMPGAAWQAGNEFGEFCLLRHRANVADKLRKNRVDRA